MKIREKKSGRILTVNDSYGMRMIEQGKASFVQEKAVEKKPSPAPAAKPAEEK
ncbi:MAG: hypothetical protein IJ466_07300 [Clostridia bacterium]|nr:hypothetical protein [Clostridia bacterium]